MFEGHSSFHAKKREMKQTWRGEVEEGYGDFADGQEQEVECEPGRTGPRAEDDSTVRGTCSRLERLLPPP